MPRWLADPAELDALATSLAPGPLALDTEFIREKTYYPKLALVQLRAPGGDECLIDAASLGTPGALQGVLEGPALKIMHSPGEDLQAFQHGWSMVTAPVFDTQLAAALVGLGAGLSYQGLVQALLGIELEKGETRSDWLRRPLSESQRRYAAEDVRHLHAVHDILEERLQHLGRRAWLEEDCARLVATATDETPDPEPHLAVRSAAHLDPEGQVRLRRLLRWREATARQRDLPRSWVLDNELITQLARQPLSRGAFETMLDRHRRAPRKGHGRDRIWSELDRAPSADEANIPLATLPDPAHRAPLRAMRAAVKHHAEQLDIPEGLLGARRHLETLLATRAWPAALSGWREAILRDELMAKLP